MSRESIHHFLTFLFFSYLTNLCICSEHETSVSDGKHQQFDSPKDYTFTSNASRVKNLVNFFEELNHDDNYNSNPETRRKQDVLISLSEAASKLHLLSDGFPLDMICNKYIKLIEQPNIRTFYSVKQLVNEKRLPVEAEQDDANLVAKLQNERRFDPIGRIQTILQSLDSEKENLKSSYSQSVQKDLYDCISYYIYRYQRATAGLIEHVREHQANLCNAKQEDEFDINLRKLNEVIERIESIETNQELDVIAWLRELSKLNDIVNENNLEIPIKVQKFITQPDRLQRLESYDQVLNKANELKQRSVSLEGDELASNLKDNQGYKKILLELNELQTTHQNLLPVDIYNYIHEPDRWVLIREELSKEEDNKNDGGLEDQKPVDEPCSDLAGELLDNLRVFTWHLTSYEEAKNLSVNLSSFMDKCYEAEDLIELSHLSSQMRWPIISLTRKLSSWCLGMLKDTSLTEKLEENRQCLMNVLEVLNKIKAKDLKSSRKSSKET